MNEQSIRNTEAMLKDTENYPFVGDVIDQLKIGRTAFYRYFPVERIRALRGGMLKEIHRTAFLWSFTYLCLDEPNHAQSLTYPGFDDDPQGD